MPAIVFGAVGTAGQRCTSTRRLFVHESIHDDVVALGGQGLQAGRRQDRRSDRRDDPDGPAQQPGRGRSVPRGDRRRPRRPAAPSRPAATAMRRQGQLRPADHRHRPQEQFDEVVQTETFAPILYVMQFKTLDEAIAMQNAVPQGLSSAIFTQNAEGGRALPVGGRLRLRHRQRQHRHLGRRNRRRLRRREGNRRRPRVGLRCVEGLHAPPDQHDQLLRRAAAGAGHQVRVLIDRCPRGKRNRSPWRPVFSPRRDQRGA